MKPFNESKEPELFNFKLGKAGFHGDVILKCEILPSDFDKLKPIKENILAYGEFSGHSHSLIDGEVELRQGDGCLWLNVLKETILKHQEHNPVLIPVGTYRVDQQQEYDYIQKIARKVAD